jgi:hypothetical protein
MLEIWRAVWSPVMQTFDPVMPVLSRGKHRNPRKGACFMEYASYLAGEPWSDHPACTHPLLASVARDVNDCMSDAARTRLTPLVPTVIGLTSDDPKVAPRVTAKVLQLALPIVSQERQHILAVALLVTENELATLEGREPGSLTEASRAALDSVPAAARWARRFIARPHRGRPDFERRTAPRAVSCAVEGISQACVPNPEERLYDVLVAAIDEFRVAAHVPSVHEPVRPSAPDTVRV